MIKTVRDCSFRLDESLPTISKKTYDNIIPLPTEFKGYVALPRSFRAYIFTCTNRRETIRKKRILRLGKTEILFSGQELKQQDLDAFLAVKHLALSKAFASLKVKPSSKVESWDS